MTTITLPTSMLLFGRQLPYNMHAWLSEHDSPNWYWSPDDYNPVDYFQIHFSNKDIAILFKLT